MIVWGGDSYPNYFNTGGRYNPGTDSWIVASTTNAPIGREYHTAVWTGSEMVVWGGFDGTHSLNTGGRYDPGPIVGQRPAVLTRQLPDTITRQSGLAVK